MNEEILKKILTDQFGTDPSKITLDTRLTEDLGADSLDMIEIVMEVESQFEIQISDEEYLHCTTVKPILELIENKLNKLKLNKINA